MAARNCCAVFVTIPNKLSNGARSRRMNQQGVVLATAGYDHCIRFWDASTGASTKVLKVTDSQVNALAISPDKRFVAAACNPCIKVWDLTKSSGEGSPYAYLDGHIGNVTNVGFDADGKWLYSGGEDGTIRIWDPRASTSACQRVFETSKKSGDDEGRDMSMNWSEVRKAAVNSVVLHPNQGELISGDQGGRIRVFDLGGAGGGAALTVQSPEPEVAVRSVAITNDGTRVFFATDSGCVHWWQPHSSETLLGSVPDIKPPLKAHDAYILKIMVSPDGKLLATASADHTAKIFRISDMARQKVLAKHQRWVWDLQFSADSSYLVTASSDTSCRLWDVSTGESVGNFLGHHKAIVAVCLNDASFSR